MWLFLKLGTRAAHLPFHFPSSPRGVVWSWCLERIHPLRQREKYLNDEEEQNSMSPSNKQDTPGTCWAPSSFVDSFCTSSGDILEQQSLLKKKCKDSRQDVCLERARWQPYHCSNKVDNYTMITTRISCVLVSWSSVKQMSTLLPNFSVIFSMPQLLPLWPIKWVQLTSIGQSVALAPSNGQDHNERTEWSFQYTHLTK